MRNACRAQARRDQGGFETPTVCPRVGVQGRCRSDEACLPSFLPSSLPAFFPPFFPPRVLSLFFFLPCVACLPGIPALLCLGLGPNAPAWERRASYVSNRAQFRALSVPASAFPCTRALASSRLAISGFRPSRLLALALAPSRLGFRVFGLPISFCLSSIASLASLSPFFPFRPLPRRPTLSFKRNLAGATLSAKELAP